MKRHRGEPYSFRERPRARLCRAAFTGPPCVLLPVRRCCQLISVMKSCPLGCPTYPPAGSDGCNSVLFTCAGEVRLKKETLRLRIQAVHYLCICVLLLLSERRRGCKDPDLSLEATECSLRFVDSTQTVLYPKGGEYVHTY